MNEKINTLFGDIFSRNIILSKEGKILFNKIGGSENTYRELEKIIKENL